MANDLQELNDLRTKAGLPILKRWSESKVKLVEKIARLRNEVATAAHATRKAKVEPVAISTSKKTFTAVELAKEQNVNDRVLRQKLRRIWKTEKGLPPLIDDEWVWDVKHKERVKELVTRDRRAKGK